MKMAWEMSQLVITISSQAKCGGVLFMEINLEIGNVVL